MLVSRDASLCRPGRKHILYWQNRLREGSPEQRNEILRSDDGTTTGSMKRLGSILGGCPAVQCLEAALIKGRLFHAYLLLGSDEGAKLDLVRALAKTANCQTEHSPGEYCDTCSVCRQITAGNSPYLRIFERLDVSERPDVIDKDVVHDFIAYASLKTQAGHLRISVLRGADNFTDTAGDRVLKTIEEPIAGNVFFLLSHNSRRVLPTIRSRVQMMKVERAGGGAASMILESRSVSVEDIRLEALLEFAKANVGLSETVSRLLRTGSPGDPRANAMGGLQSLTRFMEGVLRARGKVPPAADMSLATEPELARVNFVLTPGRVWPFLNRLGERIKHVEQNVNPELVLTNALLELRRMTTNE